MAAGSKGGKSSRKSTTTVEPVSANEKIARLLAVLATKDMEQTRERAVLLRAVGFDVSEVASLLGISENNVRVASHHGRQKRKGKKAARKAQKKH